MMEGFGGAELILYFLKNKTQMNFVYAVLNRQSDINFPTTSLDRQALITTINPTEYQFHRNQ